MKKRKNRLPFCILFISSIIISLFAGSAWTLAWFMNNVRIEDQSKGEVNGAYYAYGNGSKGKPFGITSPRHLYNFAWLQYLGTYNKPVDGIVTPTYFELASDIDMAGLTLPPIGTKDNPFVSSINGNGHTIKNLMVTDDISNMKIHPSVITGDKYLDNNRLKGAEIIGTFGVIGKYPYINYDYEVTALDNTVAGNVYDLYIDKAKIQPTSANVLAGLIAGYVNGKVKYCGVHDSNIALQENQQPIQQIFNGKNIFDKLSEYSLFGAYNGKDSGGDIDWSDKPTPGFGASLNIEEMYNRMGYIANSGNDEWKKAVNYNPESTKEGSYPNEGYALPFMVSNEISQDAYIKLGQGSNPINKNYEIVSEHNIGYLTGSNNSAKINGKQIKNAINAESLTIDSNTKEIIDFNIYTSYSNKQGDKHLFTDLSPNIKAKILDILNDSSGIIKGFRLSAQVDQNNTIQDFIIDGKKAILPSKALWFVPKEDGVIKVVIDTWDGQAAGFSLYQIIRDQNGSTDQTSPFNSNIKSTTVIQQVYQDTNGTLYYNNDPKNGAKLVYDADYTRELDKKELYYFEIPVKGGWEYALGNQNGSGPFLIYLDLGQNAGSSSKTGEIHDCDFVKAGANGKLIKIRNDTGYTESGVLISFVAPISTLIIYFNRIDKEGNDIVIYLVDPTDSLTINPKVGKNNAILSTKTTDFLS